jgi:menaquinone-9 beta-reductase
MARTVDCLVIGGGLAGAMAGLRLADAGREVLLVERESGPRPKVCGEFLSAETESYLRQSGIDPVEHGARHIKMLRFSTGTRRIEARLPFPALALSRTVLDEQLLRRAADRGCELLRGVAIEKLARKEDGWCANADDGQMVNARCVFLASGKHDLRGWARGAGVQNDLIGFKMCWRLAPSQAGLLAGAIELVQFAGGYGGLVEVEDGSANLAMVVRQSVFRKMRGWPGLLAHVRAENALLDERLEGATPEWERPMAISVIPYGYVARGVDGCWRVGDQVAVIPSFTGDGMAIALHSAALAVETLLAGGDVHEYQRALGAQLRSGIRIATALSRLMASRAAHSVAPVAMALLPMALGSIARATRIPSRALLLSGSRA